MGKSGSVDVPSITLPTYQSPVDTLTPQIDSLKTQLLSMQEALSAEADLNVPELTDLANVEEIDWADVEAALTEEELAALKEQQSSKVTQSKLVVNKTNEEEDPNTLLG